jgi:N-carbamoyl-L-amino-acid hydrolase
MRLNEAIAAQKPLVQNLLDGVAAIGADPPGITRDAYGRGENEAHDLIRKAGEALGMQASIDAGANLSLRYAAENPEAPPIIIGSHLDSIVQGGNFDGAAGVLAGLAAVAGMKRAGFQPARDMTVMAIRAEEAGQWFPTSYPGSKAALGLLAPEILQVKRTDSGRTLAEHMREEGFDPDAVARGEHLLCPENTAAFLDVPIEQGPSLDSEGLPIGIVTGIP